MPANTNRRSTFSNNSWTATCRTRQGRDVAEHRDGARQDGDHEGALASYTTALEWEGRTGSYFVAQQHAAHLASSAGTTGHFRVPELIERPDIKPEDRELFVANATILRTLVDG